MNIRFPFKHLINEQTSISVLEKWISKKYLILSDKI